MLRIDDMFFNENDDIIYVLLLGVGKVGIVVICIFGLGFLSVIYYLLWSIVISFLLICD